MPDTKINEESIKRFGGIPVTGYANPPIHPPIPPTSNFVAGNTTPQQTMPQMPNTVRPIPSPLPPNTQTKSVIELSRQNLLEIKALLLTLTYLNQSMPPEKQNKPCEDEDAFRLTKAFMRGCKEAGLTSDQTQKLLDELLTEQIENNQTPGATPAPLPRKINPYLQIVFNIQRKLGL